MSRYRDLFKGTAWYYARYRPEYPEALYPYIRETFHLDRTGRLLDLGCGTGQMALGLADDFEEVVGLDPEPEMLAEAVALTERLGKQNITWVEGGSGDLDRLCSQLGEFRLVTMGRAFHWMDREAALQSLSQMVVLGGGLVTAGDGSFYTGDSDWQVAIQGVIRRWLGQERRAGNSTYINPSEHHESILSRSSFSCVEVSHLNCQRDWTIETVIGNLYSTSFCSPAVLGEKREPFEADLRQTLLAIEPSGVFREEVSVEVIAAWKIGV